MKIALGTDHAGMALKDDIIDLLESLGHEVMDLGAYEFDPDDDYPDLAAPVARAVSSGQAERGIILCGSGVGAAIAANKIHGARASVCHDTYTAAQGVEHDNMNVLCLGSRVIGPETARAATTAFLGAKMDPHPRFKRRLDKVIALETDNR
ncbi:MAG: RpiB/LacA/LacB family sugar-phosphate isomerase [Chloroflexi bacterium]|nr:RpiB/LacA/LacB family sugar-phosphate isomerase [Chloroflexota bacterium]